MFQQTEIVKTNFFRKISGGANAPPLPPQDSLNDSCQKTLYNLPLLIPVQVQYTRTNPGSYYKHIKTTLENQLTVSTWRGFKCTLFTNKNKKWTHRNTRAMSAIRY